MTPPRDEEAIFFYGTLMAGFDLRRRAGIDGGIVCRGRGWIRAALFDLGSCPAAVPGPGRVWGEACGLIDSARVLRVLDDIEGSRPDDPDRSLYHRSRVPVHLLAGGLLRAWVYFYRAPLGRAPRIPAGDYREHVRAAARVRRPGDRR